jgi:hypothetical protein
MAVVLGAKILSRTAGVTWLATRLLPFQVGLWGANDGHA